jgi:outer membrane protein assembly complex protein YaeT
VTRLFGLVAGLVACAGPLVAQDTVRVVRGLHFQGNHSIDGYTLSAAIGTTNSNWFARTPPFRWIGLGEKREFDELEMRKDVLRLTLFYRQSGFMDVVVDTVIQRSPKDVDVKFVIKEGPPIVVKQMAVTGLDSVPKPEKVVQDLPLVVGKPFNRFLFQASADTILRRLKNRGYPSAAVFRNYAVDRAARTATLSLEVAPGTRARVGTIHVAGSDRVDSVFIRQLLTLKDGQRYSEERLFESQRKLYQTQLFGLATVKVDSTKFQPGDSVVPLDVSVRDGLPHRIRSAIGYATEDCFRGGVGWTHRNLLNTGRLFDISGRVSKVGVGRPTDWGLENNVCSGVAGDTIGSSLLNYNVTASVRQPRFFSPIIAGTLSLFAERRSEFQVYRREEIGLSGALVRENYRRIPMTLGYRMSYGRTVATAATFCAYFNACTPTDAERLSERRVLGVLGFGVTWPRSNNLLDPSRGHVYTIETAVSSPITGSDPFQEFYRVTGDAAWYQLIGRDVVLSWHLRGGIIFAPVVSLDSATGNFIPPEERYYAGGPNDVRGYNQNELGPVVYVYPADSLTAGLADSLNKGLARARFSATGGNTVGIGQVELRVPSPIWPRRIHIAAFVDAGALWERGKTNVAPFAIRVTPGMGIRIATPLGPARLDVGYNPYHESPGALYLERSDGTLILVQDNFVQAHGSRFTLHFSFGQPF